MAQLMLGEAPYARPGSSSPPGVCLGPVRGRMRLCCGAWRDPLELLLLGGMKQEGECGESHLTYK